MRFLRRLRGAVGTGLTWAAGWAVLGGIHGFVIGALRPWHWEFYNPVLTTAVGYAVGGLIAGTGFGAILAWAGRRESLERISRFKMALCGAIGGAALPVIIHLTRGLTSSADWGDVALTASVTAVLGAGSAVASLWIARRSDGESGRSLDDTFQREMLSSPAPDWSSESVREHTPDGVRGRA
jgi:hypothetical protein